MDMKLTLKRKWFGPNATIGELYIDDEIKRQCVTLEDVPRDVKIADKTCIPLGTYQVIIDYSQRFGKLLPRLLDVPDFDGIRIHPGNTSEDTAGCILVGKYPVNADFIGESRIAFNNLMMILNEANWRGKIFIEILREDSNDPLA